MQFKNELNPKIWEGNKLRREVKAKLEQIANAFIEFLEVPADAVKDIRIVGSSANYNYTPYSDLDLHITIDYDKVHKDCPVVEGYLWAMKSDFNKEHDISIYGVPVELYAEDSRKETSSNGIYSLKDDKWLKVPEKLAPTDNDSAVNAKYNELKDACERVKDSEVAERLLEKIYTMRQSGLEADGELSVENLAFKKLRDNKIIERLKEMKREQIDKELTLESMIEEARQILKEYRK